MKKPILVIEGQDRTGKTTLVNQLANHYGPGAIKHHSGSPPKELLYPFNKIWEDNNYFSLMNAFNEISHTNAVIIDRFHLGQAIYGKRYRGYSESFHVNELEANFSIENNLFLVLLTDLPKNLYARDDGCSFEKSILDFDLTRNAFIEEFDRSLIKNKLHICISANGGFTNTFETVTSWIQTKGIK